MLVVLSTHLQEEEAIRGVLNSICLYNESVAQDIRSLLKRPSIEIQCSELISK